MKRSSFVTLALLFGGTIVGIHMLAQSPSAAVSRPISDVRAPQPVAAVRMPASVAAVSTVSAVRPPVPLLLIARPAPIGKTPTVEIASRNSAPTATEAAASDGSETEQQSQAFAKAAIEQDGYKGVRALTMGGDGVWRGRALRGKTEIAVSVDASGNVSAQ